MMSYNFHIYKSQLVDNLWLDMVLKLGNLISPRKKKSNKELKLLTLTNVNNLDEVVKFTEGKIIKRSEVFGWNSKTIPKMRLEGEGFRVVGGPTKFEKAICSDQDLRENFLFDIINLDYTSQNPEKIEGRLEDELNSIEQAIFLKYGHVNSDKTYYGILFTTMINNCNVDLLKINENSCDIRPPVWTGYTFNTFIDPLTDIQDKIQLIQMIFQQLEDKYSYTINHMCESSVILDADTLAYSSAYIMRWN